MVAYSFRPRFVEPIQAGTKRQTIRADRRRHARPGEELQLYAGMRTKHCKLIARVECESVHEIQLDWEFNAVEIGGAGAWFSLDTDLANDFATSDGFKSVADMRSFWDEEHGLGLFSGVLIGWGAIKGPDVGDGEDDEE